MIIISIISIILGAVVFTLVFHLIKGALGISAGAGAGAAANDLGVGSLIIIISNRRECWRMIDNAAGPRKRTDRCSRFRMQGGAILAG